MGILEYNPLDVFDPELVETTIQMEGWVNRLYRDQYENVTGGVGRNFDAKPLSDDVIRLMLAEDLMEATNALRLEFPDYQHYSEPRLRGLTYMMFQLGQGSFDTFHNFKRCVLAEDWTGAAEAAADSLWAKKQTPHRASEVIMLIREG